MFRKILQNPYSKNKTSNKEQNYDLIFGSEKK